MKLPDLIKKAVLNADWLLVCKAYTAITGEVLVPPEPKKEVVDFAEFEIPDELLGEAEEDVTEPEPDDEEQPESRIIIPDVEEARAEIARANKGKKKVDDFTMPSRNTGQKVNEDGKLESRRESMKIPQSRPNRFVDDLEEEKKDLKKNNENLQKLYGAVSGRVSRVEKEGVDTGAMAEVVCSLCDKPETVAAAMAIGHSKDPMNNTYRCNSCSTQTGRAKALRNRRASEMSGR